ncbi:GNAT family N-acetyltransferase [Gemmatimonas groenlandica]|uniref:GNAT family N-acetyltransferase n=1 Tax=Gemmatimonas groenlandica TaxID=2732249 RepID=A0A6M4IN61_9BACT|nr:GNAT family N-acetyltransferase [Gemmatimonas groenlandica]QJR36130.1 GNAT family N-acetyltransferase [Gemmatimonas groenlandica]
MRSVADALRSCAMPLGCPVGFLERHRVATVQRLGDDQPVVRTFVRDEVGLVSIPCRDEIDLGLDPAEVQELIAITRLEASPGSVIELRSARLTVSEDPAAVEVLDECTIAPVPRVAGMLVFDPRRDVLDMLRHDVSPLEWNEGGGNLDSPHRVGALQGGVLVALASVDAPQGRLARVRVLVSPQHRRMGYGRAVLHALVRQVLKQGFIPVVRLAMGDLAARALASTVGFVAFARSLTLHVTRVDAVTPAET